MPSNHLILCCPLLLLHQSFPAPWSFPVSRLFASGGQTSASTSVLEKNTQDGFPLGLTGLISLQSKRLSRVFSSTTDIEYCCHYYLLKWHLIKGKKAIIECVGTSYSRKSNRIRNGGAELVKALPITL